MKKSFTLLALLSGLFTSSFQAQNTVCDSLSVQSVTVEGSMLWVTVANASGHSIVYPYFNLELDENEYIALIDTFTVPTLLSVAGDFNDGLTLAIYSSDISPETQVPFETEFTGILTITDPNDESFSCTLPFSFTYGSLTVSTQEISAATCSVFPNPANDRLQISGIHGSSSLKYAVYDSMGKKILQGQTTGASGNMTLDIRELPAGHYLLAGECSGQSFISRFVK